MSLHIQDPLDADTSYLLESLLEIVPDANFGAGTFAFVSRAGIKLLLGDKAFRKFVSKSYFDLIVGMDGITDTKSVEALREASRSHPRLRVRAFIHGERSAIYHPKYCWFRLKRGGKLVVGSGNLTHGGLRGNWETYTVSSLGTEALKEVEMLWNTWQLDSSSRLKDIGDPVVDAQAKENARTITKVRKIRGKTGTERDAAQEPGSAKGLIRGDESLVLLAEIPRASERWNQANFDQQTFREYFGAKPHSHHRISLFHVAPDGKLADIPESRESVEVRSHNYRFELAAAANLDYPTVGRPIAAFIKTGTRDFIYRLLMPGDPEHPRVAAILGRREPNPGRQVRRIRMDVATLRRDWPSSPLLK